MRLLSAALLALLAPAAAVADLPSPTPEQFEQVQKEHARKSQAADDAEARRDLLLTLGPILASAGLAGAGALWWARRRRAP